jgi:hypothetical protein
MFNNVEELKEFLLWARDQKIQHAKVGEVEVVFSALAMVGETPAPPPAISPGLQLQLDKAEQERLKKEEDELLFHSSIP